MNEVEKLRHLTYVELCKTMKVGLDAMKTPEQKLLYILICQPILFWSA